MFLLYFSFSFFKSLAWVRFFTMGLSFLPNFWSILSVRYISDVTFWNRTCLKSCELYGLAVWFFHKCRSLPLILGRYWVFLMIPVFFYSNWTLHPATEEGSIDYKDLFLSNIECSWWFRCLVIRIEHCIRLLKKGPLTIKIYFWATLIAWWFL